MFEHDDYGIALNWQETRPKNNYHANVIEHNEYGIALSWQQRFGQKKTITNHADMLECNECGNA